MKRYHINPAFSTHAGLHNFLEALPAVFADEGTILWNKRNKIKAYTIPPEDDADAQTRIVVKRFRHLNFIQQIIYTFRRHKALRAFLNGMELCNRGIDTPEPIACVEVKKGLWLKDSFYLCGETNLSSIEGQTDRPDWNRDLASAFAQYAATLHGKGVLHNDLNDTNVLYRLSHDGSYHFSVIDINRMKFFPSGSSIPLKECIENLTRFTGRLDLFEYVIRQYAKARHLEEGEFTLRAIAQKEHHDRCWRRRKRLLHPLRYLKKK